MSYPSYRPVSTTQSNGTSAHLNGNNRLHLFDFDTTPDTSADERSRSRGPPGYGGFDAPTQQVSSLRSGVDRQHANCRSRDFDTNRSRSRPPGSAYIPTASRAGAAQVDELLRYISQQWSFMASDSCIPVKVALQLMDPSSLGLQEQYGNFQQVHQQLQNALKVIVNEHHQGFNSSIGTFHKIQQAIHASQLRVRALRAGLVQAKGSLGSGGKPELRVWAAGSQGYEGMLETLGTIEQLQLVPERLEAQVSEKRFLGAVDTLQEALAMIRKPELEDIGALAELKVYLSNQEHSLNDILIEELHSHLYLKSPYCEDRWKPYAAHLTNPSTTTSPSPSSLDTDDANAALSTFLTTFTTTDSPLPSDPDPARNPEANTFAYIHLLLASLSHLATLPAAIEALEHRLPVELFRVVERSHAEVEQRHPSTLRSTGARTFRANKLGIVSESLEDAERQATLQDLLSTVLAKFEAVAEGHRVVHEVVGALLKREKVPEAEAASLNRGFRELWKLLQSEIRSLLHDHLATHASAMGAAGRRENDGSANIFRPAPRERGRRMFRLSETDGKSAELVTEREDLEFILRSSVPGLVNRHEKHLSLLSTSNGKIGVAGLGGAHNRDDNTADRSATGHKLLVEPSVFNMSVLLPPSLAFLAKLAEIVPKNSGVVASTLTTFLDDFLINVFYPQLDETLLDLTNAATSGSESFTPDDNSSFARPVFMGTVKFYEVLELVCGLLDQLPHEQSFSALVIGQMRAYYDKCFNWSKSLLQRALAGEAGEDGGLKMRLAADLATAGDINDCVISLLGSESVVGDGAKEKERLVLAEKESALLIQMVKARKLEEADLIHDRKALAALGTLLVSMKWLATKCAALRYVSPNAVDMGSLNTHTNINGEEQQSPTQQHSRRWTHPLSNTNTATTLPSTTYLPLDPSTALQFDAVLASFTELSTLILRTLHLDLRLQLLYGIYSALDTTYELRQPYNDPDPAIILLSENLSSYDAVVSTHLLTPQYSFLTQNLDVLANNALTGLVGNIPSMDSFGNARMQLNVLVLQQVLKNVQSSADLARAARFYELGSLGPGAVVERGRGEEFETGDLKALVRLCWEKGRDGGKGGGGVDEFVGRLG